MAVLNDTFQSALGHNFSDGISRTAYRIVASLSAWNDSRLTRNALGRLSDRELDDIGLSRGDIMDIH
ncbi:MAG: DUF1127 domain-containing protein [Rhodobacteraceae bacterium]|nr:DUF1127 domain-containing protein [Paracoccaceae bacterium]